jgi:hypothetical protein
MRVFHRHLSRRHLVVLSGELVVIFGATMTVAQHYRPGDDLLIASMKSAVVAAVFLLCMYYNDLYDLTLIRTTREVVIRVLPAVGAAVLIGLFNLTPLWRVLADGTFLLNITAFLSGVLAWRLAFNNIATAQTLGERILIVAPTPRRVRSPSGAGAERLFLYDLRIHRRGSRRIGDRSSIRAWSARLSTSSGSSPRTASIASSWVWATGVAGCRCASCFERRCAACASRMSIPSTND